MNDRADLTREAHPPAEIDRLLSTDRGAVICGEFRYLLWRRVSEHGSRRIAFVMLNPSTADAVRDDPTLRRCISFSRAWGFSTLLVCNLFALRTSRPATLLQVENPVGADNDAWLSAVVASVDTIVAAWGAAAVAEQRSAAVLALLRVQHDVQTLGHTASGAPRHPLYVPSSAGLLPYREHESRPQQC